MITVFVNSDIIYIYGNAILSLFSNSDIIFWYCSGLIWVYSHQESPLVDLFGLDQKRTFFSIWCGFFNVVFSFLHVKNVKCTTTICSSYALQFVSKATWVTIITPSFQKWKINFESPACCICLCAFILLLQLWQHLGCQDQLIKFNVIFYIFERHRQMLNEMRQSTCLNPQHATSNIAKQKALNQVQFQCNQYT